MKNGVQVGHILTHTPAGAVASGTAVAIGTLIGVAVTSASASVSGAFLVEGVVTLPKATGFAPAQGARLNFRPSTGTVVNTATTGDIVAGCVAARAAASGDLTIEVKLCPGAGTIQA